MSVYSKLSKTDLLVQLCYMHLEKPISELRLLTRKELIKILDSK